MITYAAVAMPRQKDVKTWTIYLVTVDVILLFSHASNEVFGCYAKVKYSTKP